MRTKREILENVRVVTDIEAKKLEVLIDIRDIFERLLFQLDDTNNVLGHIRNNM